MGRRRTVHIARLCCIALMFVLLIPAQVSADTFTRVFRIPDPVWNLASPEDAVMDSDGTVWVVDKAANRLVHFDTNGHEILSVSGSSAGTGGFNTPTAVALGPNHSIYIADVGGRVRRFDRGGHLLSSFVVERTTGYDRSISSLCLDLAGRVYVCDDWTGELYRLRTDGSIDVSYPGMNDAGDIAIGGDGSVYCSDRYDNVIRVYESEGRVLRTISIPGDGGSGRINGLAFARSGELLLAKPQSVLRFTNGGEFLDVLAEVQSDGNQVPGDISVDSSGSILWCDSSYTLRFVSEEGQVRQSVRGGWNQGPFVGTNSIAFDATGTVAYITDTQTLLHRSSMDGTMMAPWTIPDGAPFNPKRGCVAVSPKGEVYVTDPECGNVWHYSASGEYLGIFYGSWLIGPGIGFLPSGELFMTNIGAKSVMKFSSEGALIKSWPSTWDSVQNYLFPQPLGIAPNGELFVGQAWSYQSDVRVRRYSPDGRFLGEWGSFGEGPGQFHQVWSIAVDRQNRVFIADNGLNRVQWFDRSGMLLGQFTGPADAPISGVRALAFDRQGRLWVGHDSSLAVFEVGNLQPISIRAVPAAPGFAQPVAIITTTSPNSNVQVDIELSGDGANWWTLTSESAKNGEVGAIFPRADGPFYARAIYRNTAGDRATIYTRPICIRPRVAISAPHAPARVRVNQSFVVTGTVRPPQASTCEPVRIDKWHYERGRWVNRGYVKTRVSSSSRYTYIVRMRLGRQGRWRLRARHTSDSAHASSVSPRYDYVTVTQ